MSIPDDFPPPQPVRTMQIIAGAILLGVALFFVIVLVIAGQGNGRGVAPPRDLPLISMTLLVVLIVNVPLAFLIPGILTQAALKRIATNTWRPPPQAKPGAYSTDAAKLLAVRQTALIVSLALLEGTAFFGCIAYLLEAQIFVLGIILGLMVLMASIFPTHGRVRVWLEQQADRLADLRQQAGYAGEH